MEPVDLDAPLSETADAAKRALPHNGERVINCLIREARRRRIDAPTLRMFVDAPDCELLRIDNLGRRSLLAFRQAFGEGPQVDDPRTPAQVAQDAARQERADRMASLRRQGWTLKEVAESEGVSIERVRAILTRCQYRTDGHDVN